jgi:hypothetical protein
MSIFIFILDGIPTNAIRDLVHADLESLPGKTIPTSCKPNTGGLHKACHLCTAHKNILEANTLEFILVFIIELNIKLSFTLTELELDGRRIGLDVSISILRPVDSRSVERLDDITGLSLLEPELGVGNTLINHELIKLIEEVVDLLDLIIVIIATKRDVDAILDGTRLVIDVEPIRNGKRANLNGEVLASIGIIGVVHIHLLTARIKDSRSSKGDIGGVEVLNRDDSLRHLKRHDTDYC